MAEDAKITPVILCGGAGTRLWPMSRTSRPKQFLQLTGDRSQYQKTLARVADPNQYRPPIVVTNEDYRFVVAEQAQEIDVALAAVVLEPVARNTAPAIAAGCLLAERIDPQSLAFVLPSDHEIVVDEEYRTSLSAARDGALAGRLVAFGIRPTRPETAFGYISQGEAVGDGVFGIARFVEKPKAELAQSFVDQGGYLWNSGMFLFRSQTFLAECETLVPDVFSAAKAALEASVRDLDFTRLGKAEFAASPSISVDYAVFEKTRLAAVVPSAMQWSDLGSWDAVWAMSGKEADGNALRGPVTAFHSRNSLLLSDKLPLVVSDVEDLAVIASEDAVYVGRLSSAQKVGSIVSSLRQSAATKSLTESHSTSYRPWGGYTSIALGERFQVKRLFVKPGRTLSLQKHHHRAEHWVVVRGTAEVQIDDKIVIVHENQSVYIPQGSVHRLSNPGKIQLEVVEVQSGSYLGEDDIIRLDDQYGRA